MRPTQYIMDREQASAFKHYTVFSGKNKNEMNQNKSRAKQGMLKGKEKTQFEETKHGSEPDTDVTQILGLSDKELNIRL